MTLSELKQQVDLLLETRPELSDAEVLIDVEARRYNVHMTEAIRLYAEKSERFEDMDMKWVTIRPSYELTEL